MRSSFAIHAGRGCAALAAAVALGIAGAQAAPAFVSADLSISAGNGSAESGTPAGGLTCAWRETGLAPFQLITYACDAAVVGALEACVYKNKIVQGSLTQLSIFRSPMLSTHETTLFALVSNNSGRIQGSTTTAVPVSEGAGGHLCTEPAVAEIVAVRWCNASLVDTVNNLVGATAAELFQQFFSGVGPIPSCTELLASP